MHCTAVVGTPDDHAVEGCHATRSSLPREHKRRAGGACRVLLRDITLLHRCNADFARRGGKWQSQTFAKTAMFVRTVLRVADAPRFRRIERRRGALKCRPAESLFMLSLTASRFRSRRARLGRFGTRGVQRTLAFLTPCFRRCCSTPWSESSCAETTSRCTQLADARKTKQKSRRPREPDRAERPFPRCVASHSRKHAAFHVFDTRARCANCQHRLAAPMPVSHAVASVG